ncbi:MAG: hypothetical protein ACTS4V_00985 [Candidatus Hodgkinia cicadicola]
MGVQVSEVLALRSAEGRIHCPVSSIWTKIDKKSTRAMDMMPSADWWRVPSVI